MPLGAAAGLPGLDRKARPSSQAPPLEGRTTETSAASLNTSSERSRKPEELPQPDSRRLDQVEVLDTSPAHTASVGGENPSNSSPTPGSAVKAPVQEPLLASLVPPGSNINARLTNSRRAEIEELLRNHPELLNEDTSESEGEAGAEEPSEDFESVQSEPAHCGPPTFIESPPRVSLLWRALALATTAVVVFLFAKKPSARTEVPRVVERPGVMRFRERGQRPEVPESQSIGDALLGSITDRLNSLLD